MAHTKIQSQAFLEITTSKSVQNLSSRNIFYTEATAQPVLNVEGYMTVGFILEPKQGTRFTKTTKNLWIYNPSHKEITIEVA